MLFQSVHDISFIVNKISCLISGEWPKAHQQVDKEVDREGTDSVIVTPASFPDLNPIKNVCSAMMTYLRCTEKPRRKWNLWMVLKNSGNPWMPKSVDSTLIMCIVLSLMWSLMLEDPHSSECILFIRMAYVCVRSCIYVYLKKLCTVQVQ